MTRKEIDSHDESFSDGDSNAAMGESIRWLRHLYSVPCGELAQKLGVTEPELAEIEAGRTPINYPMARSAARALGLSVVQFISHVESVLTQRPCAAIEVEIPNTEYSNDAMRAIAQGNMAIKNPEYRSVLELIIGVFIDCQQSQS